MKCLAFFSMPHDVDHSIILLRSLRIDSQLSRLSAITLIFVSSANLAMLFKTFASKSLTYIMNKIDPSTYPWGTPLVTGT